MPANTSISPTWASGFFPLDRRLDLPADKLSARLKKVVLEQAVETRYDTAAHAVEAFGNTLSVSTVGRLLHQEGERLESEFFGPAAVLAAGQQSPGNPPVLMIGSADGMRYRTNEADRVRGANGKRVLRVPSARPEAQQELTTEERDRGWHEAKVGVIIRAQRGHTEPDGTYVPPTEVVKTYVGTTRDIQSLGQYLRTEWERRGGPQSAEFVWVSDHGHGLPELVDREFGSCVTQIITDFYHVTERLAECARIIHGEGEAHARARNKCWHGLKDRLWRGRVSRVIALLTEEAQRRAPRPRRLSDLENPSDAYTLWTHIFYLEKHQATMRYDLYRENGWPLGSGTAESACGQFGDRFKHNRMRWTRATANAGYHVKAAILSQDGRWARRWPPPVPVLDLTLAA